MAIPCAAAARSFLRSTASARSGTSRIASMVKPDMKRSAPSPFYIPKQNPVSCPRVMRSPVELSCCVASLLPYHTATAAALLTSMLSATPCSCAWTSEGIKSFAIMINDPKLTVLERKRRAATAARK